MIRVRIAGIERSYADLSESWIQEQIKDRRRMNIPVCVQVIIKHGDVDMLLSSSDCPRGQGGRRPNDREEQIFNLWDKLHLNKEQLNSGNFQAFLSQIRELA